LTADEAQLDKFDLVNLKVFGHRGFRPQQKDIVMQAVAGRDLFVLMPTGGGKSLCYQVRVAPCFCAGNLLLLVAELSARTEPCHPACAP
jgi:superfamily II DNA helicase RecQ